MDVVERIPALVGKTVASATPVAGGYTNAVRQVVCFEDGSSVFAKCAVDEHTAEWLRTEQLVYRSVQGAFMPQCVAFDDAGGVPLLLLEDLSDATWPPPWGGGDVARLLATLGEVRAAAAPAGLPRLEDMRGEFNGWACIEREPHRMLDIGLCSADWLRSALPLLVAAESAIVLEGDDLLHLDVRSDNLCFQGERMLLVDWNWACVGNGMLDIVSWLPSAWLEGALPVGESPVREPELLAAVVGYWCAQAGDPPPTPGSTVRDLQRRQAKVALPTLARWLELPVPR